MLAAAKLRKGITSANNLPVPVVSARKKLGKWPNMPQRNCAKLILAPGRLPRAYIRMILAEILVSRKIFMTRIEFHESKIVSAEGGGGSGYILTASP